MPAVRSVIAFAAATIVGASLGAGAHAANTFSASPNYAFADGSKGFAFATTGGILNPEVLVDFNPQPDPPGFGGSEDASPGGSRAVQIATPGSTGGYSFLIALLNVGPDASEPLPPAPNSDGTTGLSFVSDGAIFDIDLHFAGPGSEIDWAAFNPQPDPPGAWFGAQYGYAVNADPSVTFSITENDQPLSFTLAPVPEPAAWTLMIIGATWIGSLARMRGRGLISG